MGSRVWAADASLAAVVAAGSVLFALPNFTASALGVLLSASLAMRRTAPSCALSLATAAAVAQAALMVTTMLLAVAVLIALIGVGNTLGLSVLERTRESALLRALGLRRSGLRWMLAIEAVLLSVSGTAVGIVAGVFAGWVGTHAISGELNFSTVEFAMSVPQTVAVGVVACLAGVVASILPGRRAARATPVEALADH